MAAEYPETTGLAPLPAPYDPADYRWVPVRRRPRSNGWTEEKQRRFIETLADTGQVGLAAKAVGMTRETAYRLRRSAHGAAFARAWDAARHHAGSLLEDVAFERAIEGQEKPVFNEHGEVIATKRVVNDRILMFLLKHLKPDRYATAAFSHPDDPSPPAALEASLREMEPRLPAPPETLLGADMLAHELELADIADGVLPHFLREQPPEKTEARRLAEQSAAQIARGEAASKRFDAGEKLSDAEFADMCHFIEPNPQPERSRRRYT